MPLGYALARSFASFVRAQCVVEFVLHKRRVKRPGGFVLASTHISHLEPAILATHTRRTIHWIARVEFFRLWWFRPLLKLCNAISIDRNGVAVAAIRRSVRLAKRGQIVGIFPEGGVQHGTDALVRGGGMKRGVCLIAIRAGVPIVPAVVLGVDQLNRVAPWLPFKKARVWVAYGEPIFPPSPMPDRRSRREARFALADKVQSAFAQLYAELLERAKLTDAIVP